MALNLCNTVPEAITFTLWTCKTDEQEGDFLLQTHFRH